MELNEKKLWYYTYIVISTTLTNAVNDQSLEDYKKIIYFSKYVFGNDKIFTKKSLEQVLLEDLTIISTFDDVKAYRNDIEKNKCKDIEEYLNLKCEVLDKIQYIYTHAPKDGYLMDYSYLREYESEQRFNELSNSSLNKQIDINLTLAVCLYLGIGCEKDIESSIYRFKQNAFMGDIEALYFLRAIYKELDDLDNFKLYDDLISLEKYLIEGRMNLSNSIKQKYSMKAIQTYNLISLIKENIGNTSDYINTSFMEVILNDEVDYKKKIECINYYNTGLYKDVLISLINPSNTMSFKVKEVNENEL